MLQTKHTRRSVVQNATRLHCTTSIEEHPDLLSILEQSPVLNFHQSPETHHQNIHKAASDSLYGWISNQTG
jgi:hypothetical protein